MPYVKLAFPPGMVRAGTQYDGRGRWIDGTLVRWEDGILQPFGGWTNVEAAASFGSQPVRGMLGRRCSTTPFWRITIGTYEGVYSWAEDDGVVDDITPALFSAGSEHEASGVEASCWTFDVWNEDIIGVMYEEGVLYRQSSVTPTAALTEIDSDAPTGNSAVVVTPEQFIMALGADRDPRTVAWCDQGDETVWTPASGNQAGSYTLPGSGWIMNGKRGRGETLIWTDMDLWAATYTGDNTVYRFDLRGQACGPVSRRAMAMVDGKAVWMGRRGFYVYDGFVRKLECTVADYVFENINQSALSKVAAVPNPEFGEVIWFYAIGSNASNEPTRYVVYNYVLGIWYVGALPRTDGIERGPFQAPYWTGITGALYKHETGTTYTDVDSASYTPHAESGPIELGDGDNVFMARQYIPDEDTLGEVNTRLYTRFYPTGTETTNGPYTNANPTDVRFTGRQVRVRHTQVTGGWRVGTPRLEVTPGGRR